MWWAIGYILFFMVAAISPMEIVRWLLIAAFLANILLAGHVARTDKTSITISDKIGTFVLWVFAGAVVITMLFLPPTYLRKNTGGDLLRHTESIEYLPPGRW